MANGLLNKLFGTHVACGCRPHMSMCGSLDLSIVEVEVVKDAEAGDVKWCEPCLAVWFSYGCGNCGCNSDDLCSACYTTIPATAD